MYWGLGIVPSIMQNNSVHPYNLNTAIVMPGSCPIEREVIFEGHTSTMSSRSGIGIQAVQLWSTDSILSFKFCFLSFAGAGAWT